MSEDPIWFTPPPPPSQPPEAPAAPAKKLLDITIDGAQTQVPEGMTLLEALRARRIDTPTLCYLENLTPVNVCRVCVVEVVGARTLVPSCSRKVEQGMSVLGDDVGRRQLLPIVSPTIRRPIFLGLGSLCQSPGYTAYLSPAILPKHRREC